MWPGPRRLLEVLPQVPRQRALPARLADPAVADAAIRACRELLTGNPDAPTPVRNPTMSDGARALLDQLEGRPQ